MCFGNEPPPPPQLAAAPPPPEIMDIIDEVSGVQSVIVTGADGKKRRVTSRLPRTPEEEQRFKMAEELIASSMRNITQLYQYNPQSAVDYAPLIQTFANLDRKRIESLARITNLGNIEEEVGKFKQMQSSLIDDQFAKRESERLANLAHTGLGESSFAAESRAAMTRAHGLARMEGDARASVYGEDLAAKRLARNKDVFALDEMGRQGELQTAQNKYALAKSHEADMDRRRLQAIEEQKGLMNIGGAITGNDLKKAQSGNPAGQALAEWQAQSADSMNRYNADINRQNMNYQNQLADYNAQGPSTAESLFNVAGKGAMAMFTGGADTMAGQLGKKFIG
jgi:hypothetical protein